MSEPPDGVYRKPYAGEQVLTADRVPLADGLRVWTNDLEVGTVALGSAHYEWHPHEQRYVLWFSVIRDGRPADRGVLQSDDRVATRHPGSGKDA